MARHHSLLAVAALAASCSSAHHRAGAVPVPEVQAAAEPDSPERLARLIAAGASADEIDAAAHQRYASVSHLYWYTDLAAAQTAAKAAGKPILSLRMLGRLDEDLSCANSRFFRVVLYANAALSAWLRDHFILHWSSERPVPKVTIDMGDGRRIETTVGGNSAHYVLDAEGRVLDVLPGLMTPRAFRRELEGSLELAETLAAAGADQRGTLIQRHHDAAHAAIAADWEKLGADEIPEQTYETTLAAAERVAYAKSRVEMPVVKLARLGPTPASLAVDSPAWEQIGTRLLALRGLEQDFRPVVLAALGAVSLEDRASPPPAILDAQSEALLTTLAPADWSHAGQPLDDARRAILLRRFEASIVADTALDLLRLRRDIHAILADAVRNGQGGDFATVNEWLYTYLFRTPASDPWLGLATPDTFTGLPHSGMVVTE